MCVCVCVCVFGSLKGLLILNFYLKGQFTQITKFLTYLCSLWWKKYFELLYIQLD